MKTHNVFFAVILMVLCSGCGVFSNSEFFEGEGQVSGVLVDDGQPLEGVLVFVLGEPENRYVTGADGGFTLTTHAGKKRYLIAQWAYSLGLYEQFELAGDGHQKLGQIEMGPIGSLEGKIESVDPARVEVAVLGTPFVTRPKTSGDYRLLLPAGEWQLQVRASGYVAETVDDILTDSGTTRHVQTISLPPDPDYTCEGTEQRRDRFNQGGEGQVDILFVVDNSGSMVGEQQALATSFGIFTQALETASLDYHMAIITTGVKSDGCPECCKDIDTCQVRITGSCINETGENGVFQDRLGHNRGSEETPDFVFDTDSSCSMITEDNLSCFYDATEERGTVMVGVLGCGYERGLSSIRRALSGLTNVDNIDFLRPWARLAVVLVSDEEDCGEVGDVSENIPGAYGKACYYAAKGEAPTGDTIDPEGLPYTLTPVEEYADFLENLKPVPGLASFSAIVGLSDPQDPSSTTIEFESDDRNADILPACSVGVDCTSDYCRAYPGTRYIELAQRLDGAVETICQEEFSAPMLNVLSASTGYTHSFELSAEPVSPDTIEVWVNYNLVLTGYQYNPETRSIVFDEDYTPHPYSLVEISYEVACD